MTCPNCEAVVAEGERFCPNCGADLLIVSDKEELKHSIKDNKNLFKMICIAVCILVLIAGIITIVVLVMNSKGETTLNKISDNLGRSVAMAEKNTGLEFNTTSDYEILKEIYNYNYIYEAPNTISVEGVKVPEWVIFISVNSEQKIDSVTYYDFSILKSDWRGEKASDKFDTNSINYKTSLKEAKRAIPMKPLSITCSNQDETVYIYKYHYLDSLDKNEKVYYLSIKYDMDQKVKSIENKKCDYVSIIFK